MKMRQYTLNDGPTKMVAWLEDKVHVGQFVTLKNSANPEKWWRIIGASEYVVDREEINRNWKVGGMR